MTRASSPTHGTHDVAHDAPAAAPPLPLPPPAPAPIPAPAPPSSSAHKPASGFSFQRFLRRFAAPARAVKVSLRRNGHGPGTRHPYHHDAASARKQQADPASATMGGKHPDDEKTPLTPTPATGSTYPHDSPLAVLAGSAETDSDVRRVWINHAPPPLASGVMPTADSASAPAAPAGAPAAAPPAGSSAVRFPSNGISTTKYSPLSFLPKNLYEQFRRVANSYFLLMVVLQFIPTLEVADPSFAALPIILIVAATAMKDAVEDFRRRLQDNRLNEATTATLQGWTNVNVAPPSWQTRVVRAITAPVRRLVSGAAAAVPIVAANSTTTPEWATTKWKHVQVGDLVRLHNNESVPADIAILSTSELDGMAYIETKSLDGETNLKIRRGPTETAWIRTPADCARLEGVVQSELPNPAIYKFHGTMVVRRKRAGPTPQRAQPVTPAATKKPSLATAGRMGSKEELLAQDAAAALDSSGMDPSPEYQAVIAHDRAAARSPVPHEHAHHRHGQSVDIRSAPAALSGPTSSTDSSSDTDDDADDDAYWRIPLSPSSVLLRGCTLRNTEWMIGVVLYTGSDTKIQLNAGGTPSKRTRIEKQMNPQVILNFVILAAMCLVCGITHVLYFSAFNFEGAPFALEPYEMDGTGELTIAVTTFFTCVIIFQNLIPISLYVTVEIVKTMQAYFIYCDELIYDEALDKPCAVRTWNLSDDLGQIEYIFSDKTGTLTQNVMQLRKCSIAGRVYGDAYMKADARDQATMCAQMLASVGQLNQSGPAIRLEKPATFVDTEVVPHLADPTSAVTDFFRLLAVCNTVLPEKVGDADAGEVTVTYKAQSPDEEALVASAQAVGVALLNRSQNAVVVAEHGVLRVYDVLEIIEFNSTRKRMSVVVRDPDGHVRLLTKGADSVIFERLAPGQAGLMQTTLGHLQWFANDGLRTLCVAARDIDEQAFRDWHARYQAAGMLAVGRDEAMDAIAEELERDLVLMGATAIEDKLQDQVPETIAKLLAAGIRIWVLTGDKVETAITVGFSCNLLERSQNLIVIQGDDYWSTRRQLQESLVTLLDANVPADTLAADEQCDSAGPGSASPTGGTGTRSRSASGSSSTGLDSASTNSMPPKYALVIDGSSLKYALQKENRLLFLEVGCRCVSVVVARASPLQKAQVVQLVRQELDSLTLAVGDGANDVSMIQAANVGVGIAGLEGAAASLSSDYAIGQFRFLQRLLLVHGRWSYRRISVMNLTFFYKNIIWTFVLFWYQCYCGFSGSIIFEYSYVNYYNLAFTVIPSMLIGILDQDVPDYQALAFPKLFIGGLRQEQYNTVRFWLYILDAIYQSLVAFFFGYLLYTDAIVSPLGYSSDLYEAGTAMAAYAIITANVYMVLNIKSWSWLTFVGFPLNVALFPLYVWVYAIYSSDSPIAGLERVLLANPTFWLSVPLAVLVAVAPRLLLEYWRSNYLPTDVDIVREMSPAQFAAAVGDGIDATTAQAARAAGAQLTTATLPTITSSSSVVSQSTGSGTTTTAPTPSALPARILGTLTQAVDTAFGTVREFGRQQRSRFRHHVRPSVLLYMGQPEGDGRRQPNTGFAFSADEGGAARMTIAGSGSMGRRNASAATADFISDSNVEIGSAARRARAESDAVAAVEGAAAGGRSLGVRGHGRMFSL
ncbi:phospholipid-translocating P-type ATPase, flippase [Allomyces macrogynus ATCC 38327]|uniref:Phospholipid-transporting ATPase n=1 Tax=Allomyces macrogynus (strain ATCC 38327) TaxID=578462 RepID=A0A0L0SF50_ALLM3|nr:phospholipid-translocating P-type ATPase, flippase [Allomyces macrogynus ATCC 38327]|eukprot:KNE61131.1 phospholipid-translocating P-type ATPase, flippase [Allomyces macrogynus ATCC 38327]